MMGVEVRSCGIHRERILPRLFDCDRLHLIARRSVSRGRRCTSSNAAQSGYTVPLLCTKKVVRGGNELRNKREEARS